MTTDPHRPIVDVHDPRFTAVEIARRIDELTRALNYATRARQPRLEHPADVYEVLGSLSAALTNLPQFYGQLARYLRDREAASELDATCGFPHAGRPEAAVETATKGLRQAAAATAAAVGSLDRARQAISGLARTGWSPGVKQRDRLRPHVDPPRLDRGRVIEP